MTEHGPGEHAGLRSWYSHDEVSSQPDQGEEGVLQGRSQGQTLATERPQVMEFQLSFSKSWKMML